MTVIPKVIPAPMMQILLILSLSIPKRLLHAEFPRGDGLIVAGDAVEINSIRQAVPFYFCLDLHKSKVAHFFSICIIKLEVFYSFKSLERRYFKNGCSVQRVGKNIYLHITCTGGRHAGNKRRIEFPKIIDRKSVV